MSNLENFIRWHTRQIRFENDRLQSEFAWSGYWDTARFIDE